MCTVKTPKPKPAPEEDPVYMRNPFLDGLGIGAESRGRNSLRIDRGSPVPTAPRTGGVVPPPGRPPLPGTGGDTGNPGNIRDRFPGRILRIAP